MLELQPTRVDTGSCDQQGLLVFSKECLVAILVKLSDEHHGDERGRWFLEIGFNRLQGCQRTFADVEEAQTWILMRLSTPDGAYFPRSRLIIR